MKTAKQIARRADYWGAVRLKWATIAMQHPKDKLTQASAKAMSRLANDQEAKLKAEAANLIGR